MKRKTMVEVPVLEPSVPKLAYTVDEAGEALNLGRSLTLSLISDGRLRAVRFGRKIIIPVSELQGFLDRELIVVRQTETPHAVGF